MANTRILFDGSIYGDSVVTGDYLTRPVADVVYINQSGDTNVGELQTSQTTFTNVQDLVSKKYVDDTVKNSTRPDCILSQSPLWWINADMYTSSSNIYDISSNNQNVTQISNSGSITLSTNISNVNNHKYLTFDNAGLSIGSDTSVYTVFAVVKYTATSLRAFVFGRNTSTSDPLDFHDGSYSPFAITANAIISSAWGSANSYNNFYLNGILTNATSVQKTTNWFLYAFTSTTTVTVGGMLIERGDTSRLGGASIAEAFVFQQKLSDVSFKTITEYLVEKYGITYGVYSTFNPTSDVSWNNNKIINLANPVNAQDSATKNYTDTTFLKLNSSNLTSNLSLNNLRLVNVADPSNRTDVVNKSYVDYRNEIIKSQSPYFWFNADAYANTSSIVDISGNNQSIIQLSNSGTVTLSSGLNNHNFLTFVNLGLNIGASNVNIFTAFVVVKYTNTSPAFVLSGQSAVAGLVDFHDGSYGGTYVSNTIMSLNNCTVNTYSNFYLNGVLTNAGTTVKPSNWFLYAFTSSTSAMFGSLLSDRNTITRLGNASIAEAIVFTTQLSSQSFQQITDYLLVKYGLNYAQRLNPLTDISLLSNRLTNVSNPVSTQDAATMDFTFNTSGFSIPTINTTNFTSLSVMLDNFSNNIAVLSLGSPSVTFTNNNASFRPSLVSSINGLNYFTFSAASTQFLSGQSIITMTAPSTYFAVIRPTTVTTLTSTQRIFGTVNNIIFGLKNNNLIFTTINVKDYTTTTTAITPNVWNIIVYRFNSNFSVDFSINGSSTYENITGTSNANTTSLGNTNLGCGSNIEYFTGDIAGVYVVNTAFSNTQINQFVGILAYRFALVNLLPSNHVYKTNPPIFRSNALDMNKFQINNVLDPTSAQDVATKNYVDVNSNYIRLDGGNTPTGTKVYRVYITTASVTGYTFLLRIGESATASSYDFALNNDSLTFPSSYGSNCSWSFGINGDNIFPFYVVQVTGTSPNRTALVYVYYSDSFVNQLAVTLNVTFTGTSLQNIANTFTVFSEDFSTALNSSKWPFATNVSVNTTTKTCTIGSSSTNVNSNLLGVGTGYGDNIELIFYGSIPPIGSSYVGGGFNDYFIENSWQNTSATIIINRTNGPANTQYTLFNTLPSVITGANLFRLARTGTNGRVNINQNTYITSSLTTASTTNSYLRFDAFDQNNFTVLNFIGIRKYISGEPSFSVMGSVGRIINMGGISLLNTTGGTLPNDMANIGNLNVVVNTICSTTGGAAVACLRADGTTTPTGNINLGSKRVTNLAEPVSSGDAATKNYIDTIRSKFITSLITIPANGTSNYSLTGTITNSIITTSSVLLTFQCTVLNQSSTNLSDNFNVAVRSYTLNNGNISFVANITRVDTNAGWTQLPILSVLLIFQ